MKTVLRLVLFSLALLCTRAFANTINAASGNLSDVQSAVSSANPGDTVLVPAGTAYWSGNLGISKSIVLRGAGSASTFIVRSDPNSTFDLIDITPSSDVPVTVDGFSFDNVYVGEASGTKAAIQIFGPQAGFGGTNTTGLTQILIQNCKFHGGYDVVQWNYFAYGCMYNCTWTDCAYAITCYCDGDYDWARPLTFGTKYAAIAENCTFNFASIGSFDTLTDCARGGRLVVRYSTMDFRNAPPSGFGAIFMLHGNSSWWTGNPVSDSTRGAISIELYNNTIITGLAYRIIYVRGGRGIVANNAFTIPCPLVHFTEEEGYPCVGSPGPPYRTTWPAEDQVNNFFIWGNTINGAAQQPSDIGLWNGTDSVFIQQNRDYWLQAPGSTTVTNYPQPAAPSLSYYPAGVYYAPVTSYTAFPYPHPLRSGSSGSTPTPNATPLAPSNLRVSG